jgi:hypothetical protein
VNDMSSVIVAKSDQLNADDLISGPRVITIREVSISAGTEQPVSIYFDGDDGKPWKPCKTMSRVLVGAWGPDAKLYVGRSLQLYRDGAVTWGGMKVGGIRISHMSDIQSDLVMALMASNKKKAIATIKPLVSAPKRQAPDHATAAVIATLQNAARCGMPTLEAAWKEIGPDARKALRSELDGLKKIAADADAAEPDDFASSPAGDGSAEAVSPNTDDDAGAVQEGPDDSQRGDGDADREAREFVTSYIKSVKDAKNPDELAAAYKAGDSGAARIRSEFPELYPELDAYRPADAPERGLL